ncbi:ABC transporter permease [Ferrovum sp. PN-J185]|uniref:ABC transporter permease n=1 Tax=Ferrovum sp. PN-J185 TaxID=1356306 RepID=UPI00079C2D54|nr:ABC transporter permease [Ferrovum sp. PN-J185]KXW56461.1 inner membrane transport permease YbhS [Ferrovum sp. PN-J185]MCC6068190.1 ABC transporter permease [Ferrovum sp. PN-J185]
MNKQRLIGLIKKEFIQIIRDPSAIAIAFIMPVILLFIFGYGVSLDAHHIPIAVVEDQHTHESSEFIAGLNQSSYFSPHYYTTIDDAQKAMMNHEVNAILWIRDDFAKNLYQNKVAPISTLINGTDANNARLTEGYLQGVWQVWLTQYAMINAKPFIIPVSTQSRIWFNPALKSRDYLVPGLIAVIMTLIGALLTALVVAREWERGTMEALMASPVSISEILLGKLIPYFIMGMGGMLLSVVLAVTLFDVPLRGSLVLLLLFSALFLLVALGMGLLISSVAKNQFVAGQIAIIVTFLPAFILSGFVFDIHSMPAPIQFITHIVAARYYVTILQTLFLAGDIWPILINNGIALLIMAIFFLGLTWLRSRKRLD